MHEDGHGGASIYLAGPDQRLVFRPVVLGPEQGDAFKLVWDDRVIPFDVHYEPKRDDSGEQYIVEWIEGFGGSSRADDHGIRTYWFEDASERFEAFLLAIEAVLVFGSNYNGADRPDGRYRFVHEGLTYTKSDFEIP